MIQATENPPSFWHDIKKKQAAINDPDEGIPDEARRP
jgi:hypothetical protein